jgi:uroporphyrinogen decarboxylase
VDAWGVARRPVEYKGGAYDEIVRHPLAGEIDTKDLDRHPWPCPEWWDAEALAAEIRRLEAEGPYAIALPEFGDPGGMFEISWYLRGFERFLMDLAENPDLAQEILRRVTDFYVALLGRVAHAVPRGIDLVWTSDDVAHQHGSLVSPRLWREAIAPHHERLNRAIHEMGARVMYHSCGAVRPFIDGLIETGMDVLDVVQLSARGMDAQDLKARFGGRIAFHGGIDVQTTLPRGSVEDVRGAVRDCIRELGRGGGYILAPTHNVQVDTPMENLLAMYREAGSLV